jgi:hypothetical protein
MKTVTQSRPLLATEVSISTRPLIHVELELSPMDNKSDYRLYLVIEPLKIAYDAVSEENEFDIHIQENVCLSADNQSNY